ncbi:MAG TPA: HD domain-containing phosphohydrolase [Nitrospirota bacterium]|nr:HD domain-containing phosphohydrolase [Nitrospirota bacterium]
MTTVFNKIRVKISLFVVVLLFLTTLVFYLTTLKIMEVHITNEVVKKSEAMTKSIAVSAGYSILSKDLLGLDNMVFKMQQSNPDVEFIAVIGNDRKIIAHSVIGEVGKKIDDVPESGRRKTGEGPDVTRAFIPSSGSLEILSPIIAMQKRLGSVVVRVNRSALLDAQRLIRRRTLIVFAVILLFGTAGSFALSSFLTKPINELSAGVSEMKEGKADRRLQIYSRDELGILTEGFNEMMTIITDQRGKLTAFAEELEESYVSTVRVLAAAIDARDPYTHGHSARVSAYAVRLGKELGLDRQTLDDLEVACLFHDIGKIKTPDSILRKRNGLGPEEYREMMRHPVDGAAILGKAPSLHKYILPVRHHHERFDGRGYPDGLAGKNIPLLAAMISLTDTYDAMTSDRPYRSARTDEETLEELTRCAGTQLDPDLVAAFLRVMEKNRGVELIGDVFWRHEA